jgi:multidrug efflux pump subunit AcrA (membrane-fusion protein)
VWVVEEGAVHRREVEVGANNFDRIRVRRGLEPGEEVVVNGKQGLKEGRRVKSKPVPSPAAQ